MQLHPQPGTSDSTPSDNSADQLPSEPLPHPIVSIVICFRDWGLDRLRIAINSHRMSREADRLEVIVSDFGSRDPAPVRSLCEELGARHIYTESNVWSRSRALNAGISNARGSIIVTTDSDIIFTPTTLTSVINWVKDFPDFIHFVQCSDLPRNISPVEASQFDFDLYRRSSTRRPRWGMGGLAAFSIQAFGALRGLDERMIIWGAEDEDFAKRFAELGLSQNWILDEEAAIYHLYHEPSLKPGGEAERAFADNRRMRDETKSVIRNLHSPYIKRNFVLVSVVIATRDRSKLLRESIDSVLGQSFGDFELIVVDDGSEDETEASVRALSDPRIRYIKLGAPAGIPSARNAATAQAMGAFIAVHDDDDLMLPHRLEAQLESIHAGVAGSYGGWIDFSESDLSLQLNPGRAPADYAAILFRGSTLAHPTLLLRKSVMELYPYHEKFLAGSDYNLMCRILRDGLRLNHCGSVVNLRRLHGANVTLTSSASQKAAARVTIAAALNAITSAEEAALRASSKKSTPVNVGAWETDQLLRLLPRKFVLSTVEATFEENCLPALERLDAGAVWGVSYKVSNGTAKFGTLRVFGSSGDSVVNVGAPVSATPKLSLARDVTVSVDGKVLVNPDSVSTSTTTTVSSECVRDLGSDTELRFLVQVPTCNVFQTIRRKEWIEGEVGLFVVTGDRTEWRFGGLHPAEAWLRSCRARRGVPPPA